MLIFATKEMMELHFLEIPKFQETHAVPNSTPEKWMLFFKTQNEQVLEELQMADKSFGKAVSALEVARMTPAEKRMYEARLAFISDQLSGLEHAENTGIEKGMEKGAHITTRNLWRLFGIASKGCQWSRW